MANVPNPRSFVQIFGDMIDTVLSNLGLRKLKAGNPVLTVLEAAAQSDLRSTQDTFDMLNAQSLDRASGIALERIGADEGLKKISEAPASGSVTVSDSSFTKLVTKIYQGKPAPIVGTSTLYVNDASSFPATGEVYIGRGTTNYEGPLEYTAKTAIPDSTNPLYWSLTLASGSQTQKFHNLSESIVLAQGGDRTVSTGAIVQTTQGNASAAVQFSVLYTVTVPDGEDSLEGVIVVAQKPGTVGNVAAGAINSFLSAPFSGAGVTNPLPFTNGLATEQDPAFRERIRNVRQSRAKGTALALQTGVVGITSQDENKRIASASVVSRSGYPTTLYIDDGTGYEERSEGVAIEALVDRALGGEEYFQLSVTPVTKAFVTSTTTSPFNLVNGAKLAVKVGGVAYEHTFNAEEFRSISNATAFEVVASINANPDIEFSARTASSGTKVVVFAKDDTNEDVEVVSPGGSDIDANEWLAFASGRVDTLRLYKNDRLLSKDGKRAVLVSTPNSAWGQLTSPQTLEIEVDGVVICGPDENDVYQPYLTFTDQDFVDAGTGFTTLSKSNTLASWATVFNYKVPGITCTANLGSLTFTSNAGAAERASIRIGQSNSTLVSNGMFSALLGLEAAGAENDYQLDRNTGQIHLETPLAEFDKLSAGTTSTASFIESTNVGTQTLLEDAELWFVVDGNAQAVTHGVNGATDLTYTTNATESWGKRIRIDAATAVFSNVLVGDWAIFWDPDLGTDELGSFRVAHVDTSGLYFDIERPATYTPPVGAQNLTSSGLTFVRTEAALQKVVFEGTVTGRLYTAQNFVNELNDQLVGANATLYRSNRIRVATNTLGSEGDIALVAMNGEAAKTCLSLTDATENLNSHLPVVESTNSDAGTPTFVLGKTSAASASGIQFGIASASAIEIDPAHRVVGLRSLPSAAADRFGSHKGVSGVVSSVSSNVTVNLRSGPDAWLNADRLYSANLLAMSPEDDLTVVVDGDALSKRFTVPMFRRLRPTDTNYGLLNYFEDTDNGGASLSQAFGYDFPFEDFAVYMKARCKAEGALWSYYRWGPEGNNVRVNYVYPTEADQDTDVTVDTSNGSTVDVSIVLPSGAARSLPLRASTRIGCASEAGTPANLKFVFGFTIDDAERLSNVVTLDLDITTPDVATHNIAVGQKVWVQSTSVDFPSGLKTITAVTSDSLSYAEAGSDITDTAIGTISADTAEVNLTPAGILVGDIIYVDADLTNLSDDIHVARAMRISAVGAQYIHTTALWSGVVSNTPVWGALVTTSALNVYPIDSAQNTVALITDKVNVLAEADDSVVPVTGQVVTSGSITEATYENEPADPWFYMTDGVNYIKSVTSPADPDTTTDYRFEFKNAINSDLATSSFWSSEEVRIAPITTQNLVDYMSSSAVGGLFASAEIAASGRGAKLQLTSDTAGSTGSIQVQGGSANALSASIVGTASVVDSNYSLVTIKAADAEGLMGGMWVRLQNTNAMPKDVFAAGTVFTEVTTDGEFILDATSSTKAWYKAADTETGIEWQVEKHGDFVCYVWSGQGTEPFTGTFDLIEGDWAMIERTDSAGALSSANAGNFRVVRVDETNRAFWIENENAIEEVGVASRIRFRTFDSIMPGDLLQISGDMLGEDNQGEWVVEDTGDDTVGSGHDLVIQVNIDDATPTATTTNVTLGTDANLMQVVEGEASSLIKRIITISPTQSTSELVDVKFDTAEGVTKVSASAGTIMQALDKLAFPITLATGTDGYSYSTGLIGEATRVIYGDQRDTATYPGIVAAGANVNVAGPLVKRISVSLGLRVRSGVSTVDIIDRVKSAVAATVNKVGIGQPVAISDIIAAAVTVNGVMAVTVLDPDYSSSNDLIDVQPFEKALVLNLDQDVLVSLIGE